MIQRQFLHSDRVGISYLFGCGVARERLFRPRHCDVCLTEARLTKTRWRIRL